MYISLILFFLSLAGIIFMIGRKLTLIQSGIIVETEHAHPFVPDVQKIKEVISKNTKKHGYTIIVVIIRSYVQFGNFLKSRYEKIKTLIINKLNKNKNILTGGIIKKQETSKFLKVISDYKHKIRNIKHKIVEEENNK